MDVATTYPDAVCEHGGGTARACNSSFSATLMAASLRILVKSLIIWKSRRFVEPKLSLASTGSACSSIASKPAELPMG